MGKGTEEMLMLQKKKKKKRIRPGPTRRRSLKNVTKAAPVLLISLHWLPSQAGFPFSKIAQQMETSISCPSFPDGSAGKESFCKVRDLGSIFWPGESHGL